MYEYRITVGHYQESEASAMNVIRDELSKKIHKLLAVKRPLLSHAVLNLKDIVLLGKWRNFWKEDIGVRKS